MTPDRLAQFAARLQRILYYDNGSERWDPDRAYGSDTLGSVNALMHDFGLAPDRPIDERERRLQSLVERLRDAPAQDDVHDTVADLVEHHCGKRCPNVNGQGFLVQVEAVVESRGIDEAEQLLDETLAFLAED
jgi:hypothetical protein